MRNRIPSLSPGLITVIFTGVLFVLLAAAAMTSPAAAQDELPPPRADVFTDIVPPNGTYVHEFYAAEGDIVTITAHTVNNDFDPKLVIHNEIGQIVASNDDFELPEPDLRGSDARIDRFYVPATGKYIVEIGGVNGLSGEVELRMNWIVDQYFTLRREADLTADLSQPISSDLSIQEIRPYDLYSYIFDAQRGDVYTFIARGLSGDLDARIAIYYEDSNLIAANDDHGSSDPSLGRGDARLMNVILPKTGRYWVQVRGYEGTNGNVAFTVTHVARGAPVYPGWDQVLDGELEAGATQNFTFKARVGDYVTLTARAAAGSPLLDPVILLSDPDGKALLDNYNNGFSDADLDFFDARISNYLILKSGTYTVTVGSEQGTSGTFSLTINIKRDARLLDPNFPLPDESGGS